MSNTDTAAASAPQPPVPVPPERWDTQKLVALSYVWGFILIVFIILVLLIFKVDAPAPMLAVLTTLAGGLMTQSNNVAQYFFGTNKQSQVKDSTIAALSATPAAPPNT